VRPRAGFDGFQASLLDILSDDRCPPPPLAESIIRTQLSNGAWVDTSPGWLPGADAVFERLRDGVGWRAERRQMYERVVDVPRLLAFFDADVDLPDVALNQAKAELDRHYAGELGEPFATAGLCLYRDGHDSVAWHGDRIGRSNTEDTMVAIISVGSPRPLLLRPVGGGQTVRHEVGHGDLLVMGGSCQRTWEHCVPKTLRPTGPRISIQFRPVNVR
jgi:alkylated DNA repair dioxygenase AlkB